MNEQYPLKDLILPKSRVSEWEKDDLLETFESHNSSTQNKVNGLGLKELKNAGLIILCVLLLCVPKIYLANTIYYLSKDINTLQTQHDTLLDENKRLKHEVESLRYKFLILNTHSSKAQ